MDEATISDIKRESSNPYWSLVTPADLDTLLDIEKAYFNILKSFSPEQQLKHTLVINFNILLKKKSRSQRSCTVHQIQSRHIRKDFLKN